MNAPKPTLEITVNDLGTRRTKVFHWYAPSGPRVLGDFFEQQLDKLLAEVKRAAMNAAEGKW